MKNFIRFLVLVGVLFIWNANDSFAVKYDYSDATGYGTTRHTTNEWQMLGDSWNKENGPLGADSSDDGVSWSLDDGTTWGHDAVSVGQTVLFRFDMHRAAYGNHEYDQLKAWIDWDGDGVWHDTDEEIIAEQWLKGDTKYDDNAYFNYISTHGVAPNPGAILDKSFYTELIVPEFAVVGETWLRARVSCDHVSFANTNPYGSLWQGEVEDWAVTVNPMTATPEPSTLLLLGAGFGIGALRRKFKKE